MLSRSAWQASQFSSFNRQVDPKTRKRRASARPRRAMRFISASEISRPPDRQRLSAMALQDLPGHFRHLGTGLEGAQTLSNFGESGALTRASLIILKQDCHGRG